MLLEVRAYLLLREVEPFNIYINCFNVNINCFNVNYVNCFIINDNFN